jgi:hypothetical protein
MGVPYPSFCCLVRRVEVLEAGGGGGGTYTAGSGLILTGTEFSVDESYIATIDYVDSAISSAATPLGITLALVSGNYLN